MTFRINRKIYSLIICTATLISSIASAGDLSNSDLLKLIKSGLPEDVIILTIQQSNPKFDKSADGLIALKAGGASPEILKAVLSAGAQNSVQNTNSAQSSNAQTGAVAGEFLSNDRIVMIADGIAQDLRKEMFQTRNPIIPTHFNPSVVAFFKGEKARVRIKAGAVKFQLALPPEAEPEISFHIFRFALSKLPPGFRQVTLVKMGPASMGVDTKIIVPKSYVALNNSKKVIPGTNGWEYQPTEPLTPGEYGILFTGGNLYSFGVD